MKAQELFVLQGDALARFGDLLNSLLEINAFESGEVEPKITVVPISELFQRLRHEFECQSRAKDLQLEISSQEVSDIELIVCTNAVVRIINYKWMHRKVTWPCQPHSEVCEIRVTK